MRSPEGAHMRSPEGAPSRPEATPEIDWAEVVKLRRRAADAIATRVAEWTAAHGSSMTDTYTTTPKETTLFTPRLFCPQAHRRNF